MKISVREDNCKLVRGDSKPQVVDSKAFRGNFASKFPHVWTRLLCELELSQNQVFFQGNRFCDRISECYVKEFDICKSIVGWLMLKLNLDRLIFQLWGLFFCSSSSCRSKLEIPAV